MDPKFFIKFSNYNTKTRPRTFLQNIKNIKTTFTRCKQYSKILLFSGLTLTGFTQRNFLFEIEVLSNNQAAFEKKKNYNNF